MKSTYRKLLVKCDIATFTAIQTPFWYALFMYFIVRMIVRLIMQYTCGVTEAPVVSIFTYCTPRKICKYFEASFGFIDIKDKQPKHLLNGVVYQVTCSMLMQSPLY